MGRAKRTFVLLAAYLTVFSLPSCSAPQENGSVGSTSVASKPVSSPFYRAVVDNYDWGACISKVIVNYGKGVLKGTSLSVKDFQVQVVKTYAGTNDLIQVKDKKTKKFVDDPKAKGERVITGVYYSDADGNKSDASDYVTIQLAENPAEEYGKVLGKEIQTGLDLNVPLDCSYTITYTGKDGLAHSCDAESGEGRIYHLVCAFKQNQKYTTKTESILKDGYENDTLSYASYAPKNDGRKHPLIIWLHGAGGGGTDTYVETLNSKVSALIDQPIQNIMGGAYVLLPQCPTVWMNATGTPYQLSAENAKSIYTEIVMELIRSYVAANPEIDKNRIYIGGCSNGGYMTVNMVLQYPDYFAAAFPTCEAYSDSFITAGQIDALKNIPIWFTQAADDTTVIPTESTVPTYRRLVAAGAANVHFTYWTDVHDPTGKYFDEKGKAYEYPGHNSWIYVLENKCTLDCDYVEGITTDTAGKGKTIFQWLSEQAKKE